MHPKPAAHACRTLLAAAFMLAALPTTAQTYPSKTVRVVVGFTPGGVTDIVARLLAPRLAGYLGQSFVVDNRAGADSLIASELVSKSEPDGHTIYVATAAHAVNPGLYSKVNFDAYKDFSSISMIGDVPNVIVVSPSLPAKTMREFVDLARAKKGGLSYASTASITALSTELLSKVAGMETMRVAYKGSAPALVAVASGEVQYMVTGLGPMLPHIKGGKVRGIAVTGAKRSSLAPDIPTVAESGIPGYTASVWYAALAPARVPRPIIDRLNAEIRKALDEPEVRSGMIAQGVEAAPGTPDEMHQYLRAEIAKWAKVVKDTGMKIQ
jgi:tripartite-type tricarboxylate transporter receptor subunit TctC